MPWIALALAASLLAGCQQKDQDRAPGAAPAAGSQAAPAAGSQAAQAAPAGPEIPAAESLRRITELADQICACPDRACAEVKHAALQQENQRLAGRPRAKPTQAEADAMTAQAKRLSGCVQQLPP